jgi:hypothetical protein
MPDSSQKKHIHHSHAHVPESNFRRYIRKGYFDPVFYISGAILLFIAAVISNASLTAPALGAASIVLLLISKVLKSGQGVIISTIILFVMAMVNIYQWVDKYITDTVSIAFTSNTMAFLSGLSEGLVLAIMTWLYYRALSSSHLRLNKEWYSKKAYIRIFKFFFYFQVYLVLFWALTFAAHHTMPTTHFSILKSVIIANGIALLTTVILVIIISTINKSKGNKRHSHRHHHHHKSSQPVKNSDIA